MTTTPAFEFKTKARLSEALYRSERPMPVPEEDEVIVRVKACAVNPVDEQL
jgi:NADPH:quinone reductase-like Zn-dependent oxidoreductase